MAYHSNDSRRWEKKDKMFAETHNDRLASEWEARFCPGDYCKVETWLVRHAPGQSEVWQMKQSRSGRAYEVASAKPICLFCGRTLLDADELGTKMDQNGSLVTTEVGWSFRVFGTW